MYEGFMVYIELWYFLRSDSIEKLGIGQRIYEEFEMTWEEVELLTMLDGEFNAFEHNKIQQMRQQRKNGR